MPPRTQASDVPSKGLMIAYRFVPGKDEPQREIVLVPTPGPGEVLVKVLAAGVCHSDIHLFERPESRPPVQNAYTLGHEGAGIITAQGRSIASDPRAVSRLALGTYVAILMLNTCGQCTKCARGLTNLCFDPPMIGLGVDGCWAEYVVVRATCVVPVPGNDPQSARLPPAVVAVTTDAVMTPWHALTRVARVKPGQTVLIFGCGGLGTNAIQIAKHALGVSTVIATDVRTESLALASKLGADFAVTPDRLKGLLRENGLAVDVAVDLVGVQATIDAAMIYVRAGGTIVFVGQGSNKVSISIMATTTKQLEIKGSFAGDYRDLEECLQAVAEGKVRPEVESRPLEECVEAVRALARGGVKARIALVPPGFV
ncbi:alcohol dehydogenase [Trametes meyenii]|nr:alcohol dehydogenase [Trametes meyenii]